ncbi:MAG TPA: hypothetical protein VKA60_10145 [Blastocatellia bacterium]|nr:hypothetical protein [Blastocatellia bacterium]
MAGFFNNAGQGPGGKHQRQEQSLRERLSIGLSIFLLIAGLLLIARLVTGWFFKSRDLERSPGALAAMRRWLQKPLAIPVPAVLFFVVLIVAASGKVGPSRTPMRPQSDAASLDAAAARFRIQDASFSQGLELSGTGNTLIGGLSFDNQGNLYVTGGFSGSMTFDTTPPVTLTSTQDYDFFIAKYNASGKVQWARQANGPNDIDAGLSLDGALAVGVDAQGNAYVGGGFVGTLSFKDAAGNQVALLGDSDSDINFELFVAKYDTNGNLVWARGGNSGALDTEENEDDLDTGINGITEIVVDSAGTPYVGGLFAGTNFLGRAVTTTGGSDAVLAKIDPATGDPVWVALPGSTKYDSTLGLAVDNAGNLYIIGEMDSVMTFPTQPPTVLANPEEESDTFLAKYSATGQPLWAKEISGLEYLLGNHLAVNGAGDIYVTGEFDGTIHVGSLTLTSTADLVSGFLTKYDTNGNALWARAFGAPHYATGDRVAIDGVGNPYVFGVFAGLSSFGMENTATAVTIGSPTTEGRFIAMYDALGAFKSIKPLLSTGRSAVSVVGETENVEVEFNTARLVYNPTDGLMNVGGDFSGALMLDNIVLNAPETQRAGFVAAISVPKPDTIAPTVNLITPDGSKLKHNKPYTIQWQASDNIAVVSQDVLLTLDNGANFITLATNLAGNVQTLPFTPSDQQIGKGIIRIVARDAAGNATQADSPKFKIK